MTTTAKLTCKELQQFLMLYNMSATIKHNIIGVQMYAMLSDNSDLIEK